MSLARECVQMKLRSRDRIDEETSFISRRDGRMGKKNGPSSIVLLTYREGGTALSSDSRSG